MPGTPLPIVLEAMAFGTPCIALTKYGMPPEVIGAGVAVEAEWDNFGNFHIPMAKLSETINKWLQPSDIRTQCQGFAKEIAQRYTRKNAAQALVQAFVGGGLVPTQQRIERTLFPPIFCRRYEPDTGTLKSSAYRLGMNRYDHLETALAEVLAEGHTPIEVESVFKHFQREHSTPVCEITRAGNRFPDNNKETNPAGKPEHQQKGESIYEV